MSTFCLLSISFPYFLFWLSFLVLKTRGRGTTNIFSYSRLAFVLCLMHVFSIYWVRSGWCSFFSCLLIHFLVTVFLLLRTLPAFIWSVYVLVDGFLFLYILSALFLFPLFPSFALAFNFVLSFFVLFSLVFSG